MAQNRTSLILNNLVELNLPITSNNCFLTFRDGDSLETNQKMLCVNFSFPCAILLQKIQILPASLNKENPFDLHLMTKHSVQPASPIRGSSLSETEIIDFKREGIDWQFKTRMRSNSNEFLESPLAFAQSRMRQKPGSTIADSESVSLISSEHEDDPLTKNEGQLTVLGNAIGNSFNFYFTVGTVSQQAESASARSTMADIVEQFKQTFKVVQLFVWPMFRIPTGGSSIALINTSFLFESKRLNQEKTEAEFLVGLSLISGRKFIQASEKFRRIESMLLQNLSLRSIYQAMQIELIIGESMNQHSQISEKIFAFKRSVSFLKMAYQVAKDQVGSQLNLRQELEQMPHAKNKEQLKQDEDYKRLMHLHPHLVQILLMNIDSNIEAVRLAALKTIEYLLDTLGCSLDESIIQIFVAVVQTYPKTPRFDKAPQSRDGVISFFEDSWSLEAQNSDTIRNLLSQRRFSTEQLVTEIRNQKQVFSLADLHFDNNCQVKDIVLLSQSFTQTTKNYYNHILEGLLFLTNSMSSEILIKIFNEIVQRIIFMEGLDPDLQMYLFKFADKIVQICQGNLSIQEEFLSKLFQLILQKQSQDQIGKGMPISEKESIGHVATKIWQTLKSNYFLNQSNQGLSMFIRWVTQQFNSLTEKVWTQSSMDQGSQETQLTNQQKILRETTLSVPDSQKLSQLLGLADLLIDGSSQVNPSLNINSENGKEDYKQSQLQALSNRELNINQSFQGLQNTDEGNDEKPTQPNRANNFYNRQRKNKIQMLLSLELYALVDPMLFWLNFAIEKQDRLPMFKIIWRTLTKLIQMLPRRRGIGMSLDCIQIIMPSLYRVDDFCQTSSLSQEMLQFLLVVFSDIKNSLLAKASYKVKNELLKFLEQFLLTFAKAIPHNLHDEVFQVCELLIDIVGTQGNLSHEHIKTLLDALIHKYTMRSQAHKRLVHHFLHVWILDRSYVMLERHKTLQLQSELAAQRNHQQMMQPSQQHQNVPAASRSQPTIPEPAQGIEESDTEIQRRNSETLVQSSNIQQQVTHQIIENISDDFNQERQEENLISLQNQENQNYEHVQDQQNLFTGQAPPPMPIQFQDTLYRSNEVLRSGEHIHGNQLYNIVGSDQVPHEGVSIHESSGNVNHDQPCIQLYFDTFCEFTLFKNLSLIRDHNQSQSEREQVYFEKFAILLELIDMMTSDHKTLFERLIMRADFRETLESIFIQERLQQKAVKLMKALTEFFLQHNSHKNAYEHPIIHQSNNLRLSDQQRISIGQNIHQHGIQQQFERSSSRQRNQVGGINGAQSVLQFGQYLHSEPSIDLVHFINQEDDEHNRREGEANRVLSNHDGEIGRRLNQRHLNHHHYSQNFELQPSALLNHNQNEVDPDESPRIVNSQINIFLLDEISQLDNQRLVLIQTYTNLIRICLERLQDSSGSYSAGGQVQYSDSYSQLNILCMMQILFQSLCPVPTFQNSVIRILMGKGQLGHATKITDRSRGSSQQYLQMMQSNRLGHQIQSQPVHNNSSQGPQNNIDQQQLEVVPDFETMVIRENFTAEELGQITQQNGFVSEFECWDQRYQHARLAFALKMWPFLEQSLFTSSWINIKAACFSVLCSVVQVADITKMKSNYQTRLKQVLFPLLNKLLQSNESENKAGGLNILGSFCGLASIQQTGKASKNRNVEGISQFDEGFSQQRAVFDSDMGQEYNYERYDLHERENVLRDQIKITDHLHIFRSNSSFVSLAIWQEVFDLQDDWDQTISDSAQTLVQLCAPKDSVKHFNKMRQEKYRLKLNELHNKFKPKQAIGRQVKPGSQNLGSARNTQADSLLNSNAQPEHHESHHKQSNVMLGTFQSSIQFQRDIFQQNVEEDFEAEFDDLSDEVDDQYFFMESFSERQLTGALMNFKHEIKSVDGLWSKKASEQRQVYKSQSKSGADQNILFGSGLVDPSFGSSIFSQATVNTGLKQRQNQQQNLMIDFFEDNMLEEVESTSSGKSLKKQGRDEEEKGTGKGVVANLQSQNDAEDLGIIDLDKQEGSDFDDFEELDDDKLPVLKNTYSKKNRPNNSKSVAVGSRSQGGSIKMRSMTVTNEQSPEQEHTKLMQPDGIEEEFEEESYKEENSEGLVKQDPIERHQEAQSIKSQKFKKNLLNTTGRDKTNKNTLLSEGIQPESQSSLSNSNASRSTPLEIGDIQVTMNQQQEMRDMPSLFKKRGGDRESDLGGRHHFDVRSQNQKEKRRAKVSQPQLSEGDPNENVQDEFQEEQYEAISAPLNRDGKKQLSQHDKYLTNQSSIDSFTDLSSPSQTSSNHTLQQKGKQKQSLKLQEKKSEEKKSLKQSVQQSIQKSRQNNQGSANGKQPIKKQQTNSSVTRSGPQAQVLIAQKGQLQTGSTQRLNQAPAYVAIKLGLGSKQAINQPRSTPKESRILSKNLTSILPQHQNASQGAGQNQKLLHSNVLEQQSKKEFITQPVHHTKKQSQGGQAQQTPQVPGTKLIKQNPLPKKTQAAIRTLNQAQNSQTSTSEKRTNSLHAKMKTAKEGQVTVIGRPPTNKQPKRDNFMATSNQQQLAQALIDQKNDRRDSFNDSHGMNKSPGGYHSQDEACKPDRNNKKRTVILVADEEQESDYNDGK